MAILWVLFIKGMKMREIKFRAWCRRRNTFGTKQGEMWMDYLSLESLMNVSSYNFAFSTTGERGYNERNILHHETKLMQYTGLKDKNGVEIYEGDIVRWGMGGLESWNRYATVELDPCLQFRIIYYIEEETGERKPNVHDKIFGFSNFIYTDTKKYLEIIGNIHENQELLKDS